MYEAEIAKGAAALDRYFGSANWRQRIDVKNLSLGSLSYCILGQLFGDFTDGMIALGLMRSSGFSGRLTEDWEAAQAHGFYEGDSAINSTKLTEEWREYLNGTTA